MNCRNCGKENPGPLCNFCGALTPVCSVCGKPGHIYCGTVGQTVDACCNSLALEVLESAQQFDRFATGPARDGWLEYAAFQADRVIAQREREQAVRCNIAAENFRNAQHGIAKL